VLEVLALPPAINLSVLLDCTCSCLLAELDVELMPITVRLPPTALSRNHTTYVKGGPEIKDVESPLIQELLPLKLAMIVTRAVRSGQRRQE
jgi:hypothetical protein